MRAPWVTHTTPKQRQCIFEPPTNQFLLRRFPSGISWKINGPDFTEHCVVVSYVVLPVQMKSSSTVKMSAGLQKMATTAQCCTVLYKVSRTVHTAGLYDYCGIKVMIYCRRQSSVRGSFGIRLDWLGGENQCKLRVSRSRVWSAAWLPAGVPAVETWLGSVEKRASIADASFPAADYRGGDETRALFGMVEWGMRSSSSSLCIAWRLSRDGKRREAIGRRSWRERKSAGEAGRSSFMWSSSLVVYEEGSRKGLLMLLTATVQGTRKESIIKKRVGVTFLVRNCTPVFARALRGLREFEFCV